MLHSLKVPLKRGLVSSLRGEASTGGGGGIPINPFDAYYNVIGSTVYAGLSAPVGNMFDADYSTSGSSLYAGMLDPGSLPTWRQGLALYETVAIPHVGALSTINPENNPAINPNHPSSAPWRGNSGHPAIMGAYCGGAYDDTTGEWWYPIGGGHQDYAGNEPYKAQIFAEQIQWQMIRNPSGAIGNLINFSDGQEATGLYSDGRLRAVHSYSYNIAVNGKVYAAALIGQYPSGQTGKRWVVEIDKVTGEYSLVCDFSTNGSNISAGYGAAAVDPVRNKLFITGRGTTRVVAVNLNDGTFVNIGSLDNIVIEYHSAVFAPEVDRIIVAAAQGANTGYKAHRGLIVINPANNSISYPNCDNYPAFIGNAPGVAWVGDKLLLWDNATETNKFAVLTPSSLSDLSQPWTVSVITGTGAAPTARQAAGTFNRLQYSARLGGVILHNATNQQMYFMRTN